jgi:transposase
METNLARDLMSDEEWKFFERFILTVRAPNGRKPTNHRLVLDGIFRIARTGSPWRDLPEEFGKWSSVYRQFRRWTLAGLWEQIMDALNESGAVPHALQMIDSTVVRAHHQAAGANRVLKKSAIRNGFLLAAPVGVQRRTVLRRRHACLGAPPPSCCQQPG